MRISLPIIAVALLAVAPASAQDTTSRIDEIFSWVTPGMPGCSIAASHEGRLVVNRAYGLADLERDVPLTTESAFDVASIRKQFVAAAILLLVEDKRLSLSDDVRKHIPELPDYGQTITLDHLLTHTSGLRDWIPLRNFASGSDDAMRMILRQRGLNFAPGEEWSYSNSGYVLATEIVARTSGMPFSAFARTRLFEPLGMKATIYVDDLRQVIRNRALAYEKAASGWRMDMLLDNERGGGGALFSTASDLLIWNDALTANRLGAFVSEKLQEPARLNNGRTLGYARGLMLDTNYAGRVLWHGGGAAGYRSSLVRFPERAISVAVLCNAGEAADDRAAFAGRIFDLFASPTGTRPTEPAAPAKGVEELDVSSRAGLFFSETTGQPLRLIASNGRLAIAGAGSLEAVATDRFRNPRASLQFMSQGQYELNFLSPDVFELKSAESQTVRYRRARPFAPGAEDLKAYAGRYDSDELRAFFDVTPTKTGLTVRLNEATTLQFAPVDPDTFQFGQVTLRFLRDKAGTVGSFEFTNPVLRNIRYTRTGQATGGR